MYPKCMQPIQEHELPFAILPILAVDMLLRSSRDAFVWLGDAKVPGYKVFYHHYHGLSLELHGCGEHNFCRSST